MYADGTTYGQDEQERLLNEAKQNIKKQAFHMRKAIDEDNMRDALKYSVAMLGELRNPQLSPQKYYELYMLVSDQLTYLEAFFGDERSKGRSYTELYELVQHAGNVLPRLYLMIAVGCLYIKSGEGRAREVLKDLVEMCKGVQQPAAGLFLRAYLCQKSRGLLPDTGSPYEGEGGSVMDALDFLSTNFIEMNKLWVRMQHQGSVRDKEKRERERQQLQDLVGKNLSYIGQLNGLDFARYSTEVLPRVMEQIISCKDDIGQQYLMQALIQGFPDAFHLGTLEQLLAALPQLQPGVKIHSILAQLCDRLAAYSQTDPAVLQRLVDMQAFEKFREAISHVIQAQPDMAAADAVEMYVALMNFTGSVYPDKVDNVNQVLGTAQVTLAQKPLASDARAEKRLVDLLALPLTRLDIVICLGLDAYPALMGLLRRRTHKELAVKIIQGVLDKGTHISDVDKVHMLFRFIAPLVQDPADGPEDIDDEDLEEEQVLVARLLHHLTSTDLAQYYTILTAAWGHLVRGGPRRTKHTLPALVFDALQLHCKMAAAGGTAGDEVTCEVLLQWLLSAITSLVSGSYTEPMVALRLLLAAAHAASEEAHLELLAYQFFEQAYIIYEESLPDSRQRVTALQAIVGCLHKCYVFGPDNRDALTHTAIGFSSKLFKRSDQCKALVSCSHLWWQEEPPAGSRHGGQPPVQDGKAVLSALERAVRSAGMAKQQAVAAKQPGARALHVGMLVDILNGYLLHLEKGVGAVTAAQVQGLIDQVKAEVAEGGELVAPEALAYWKNTQAYIESVQKDKEQADKFQGIKC